MSIARSETLQIGTGAGLNFLDANKTSKSNSPASISVMVDLVENSLQVDIGLDALITPAKPNSVASDSSYESSSDSQTEVLSETDIGREATKDRFVEVISKRQLRHSTVRVRA